MNIKVKESLLALAVISAGSPALAIEPGSVDLGGFYMIPTVSLTTGYNDNPFSQTDFDAAGNPNPEPNGSVVTVVNPAVGFIAKQSQNIYSLNAAITHGIIHDSTDDNYTDYNVDTKAALVFNSKNNLALTAGYLNGHEDRGAGSTQGIGDFIVGPTEFQDTTFGAEYTYGAQTAKARLKFSADYLSKTYSNNTSDVFILNQNRERDEFSLSAKLLYAIGADTDVTLEARSITLDYDNQIEARRDSNEMEYFVGLEWQATAKTSGYASIGLGDKEFDSIFDPQGNLRQDPGTQASWDVGVVWEPRSYSSVVLSTSREEEETPSNGAFVDTTSYGISWNHGWNDQVSTKLFYNFVNQEYVGTNQDDDVDTYGVSVTYAFARWLDIGLAYDYTDKASSLNFLDFDREKIILSFDLSL